MHTSGRAFGIPAGRLAALGAFAATCALYAWVPWHEFVRWDDGMLIYENPAIRGITPATLRWVFTHFDPELYIPLTFISYQLNYLAGGIDPFGYLAANVVLHGMNAALVTTLALLLTGRLRAAAFCGLLFAVHPLHTEAVAWASGRKDLLSTFFFLLAWITFLRAEQTGDRRRYWGSVALHLAGTLAKVMAATLPAVLLLEVLVFRPREARGAALRLLPHAAISAVLIVVALVGKEHLVSATTLGQKLLMACVSTAFYLTQMFWPVRFSLLYPWTGPVELAVPAVAASVAVVIGLLLLPLVRWSRARIWTFCVLGYLGTLAPTFLNFSKGGDLDVYFASDRYAYVPSIFVFLGVALALDRFSAAVVKEERGARSPFAVTATFVVLVLGALAWRQQHVWKDTRSLFAHVIEAYPSASHVAHNNLGNMERLEGNLEAAVREFHASLAVRPTAKAWSNLGAVYRRQGDLAAARKAYDSALALDALSPHAHFGLGIIAAEAGDRARAEAAYRRALELDPTMEDVWVNLGALRASAREWPGAAEAYRRALELNPFFVPAHHNLGVALLQQGESAAAQESFAEAVRLQPNYVPSRLNLGVLLARSGDRAGARAQFEAVLRTDPRNATALNALSQL